MWMDGYLWTMDINARYVWMREDVDDGYGWMDG